MGDFFVWAADRLEREWSMVLRAWRSLTLIVVLVGVGLWWGISTYFISQYEGTIRNFETDRDAAIQQKTLAQDEFRRVQKEKGSPQAQSGESLPQGQFYTIKKEDELEFIKALSSTNKPTVSIGYAVEDPRAFALAKKLQALLTLARWKIGNFDTITSLGGPAPGVTIWIDENQDVPIEATTLFYSLDKQKIETRIKRRPPGGDGSPFWIFVGPGPSP
jgi:hypothetical protein